MKTGVFLRIALIFFLGFKKSTGVTLDEDLSLTRKQKQILDQFKDRVSDRLPHDYMRQDIYLIRWLRARQFNINLSEDMLLRNIKWRKENNMDTIHNEDWDQFEREYRFTLTCDKASRPVVNVFVGDWDVRKAVIAGQRDKMIRYFDKLMDEASMLIRDGQSQGKNITQYSFIFDLSNYNLAQQGCPGCIPVYVGLFTSYESHFPGGVHRMSLVNTPEIFQALLEIIKPLMTPLTREALHVYGRDKRQWQGALLEEQNADQLSVYFGGTQESPYEIEEYRKSRKYIC